MVLAGLALLRLLSLACRRPSSLHVFTGSSLSVSSSPFKDASHTELGPTHMTPFYLNCLFESPVSKYRHSQRNWGLGLHL